MSLAKMSDRMKKRKRIINVRQNEKEEAITNKLLELHFLIYKIAT
jgi:hypothetical protein